MAAPGDAARCQLVPGRPLAPGRPGTNNPKRDRKATTISEGANTPPIALRDQKWGELPSDSVPVLTASTCARRWRSASR